MKSVTVNGQSWATEDANGRPLGYPGPDGKTLWFMDKPVGDANDWRRIQLALDKGQPLR